MLKISRQRGGGVIVRDFNDLQAVLMILGVEFLDAGKLGLTGAAPGGPEVDKNYFAFPFRRIKGFVVNVVPARVIGLPRPAS